MWTGRLVWVALISLCAVLYVAATQASQTPASDASNPSDQGAAHRAAGDTSPAATPPSELECPEGTTLVDRGASLFCAVTGADGLATRSGSYVRFHDADRQRKSEAGEYVNGRKQGPWTEWYVSGARRSRLEGIRQTRPLFEVR